MIVLLANLHNSRSQLKGNILEYEDSKQEKEKESKTNNIHFTLF
jgi:hypothetical protein